MKKHTFLKFAGIFLLLLSISINSNGQSKASINKGFVKLFNGKNWDGWHLKLRSGDAEMAKKVYAIENGMVHVFKDFPDTFELNTGANLTHGLFYTNKKYSKFIFRFEYKWGTKIGNNFERWQYDAGCYFHVFDDNIWPKGYEYQVRYDHVTKTNHTGDFWAAGTTINWFAGADGKRFLLPKNGGKSMGVRKNELLGVANPKYNALNNKWNKCEVIVMADKYAIYKLNGVIVNMGTNLTQSEGLIGLQSETAEIFYRNIEIKEFDEIIPMEKFIK